MQELILEENGRSLSAQTRVASKNKFPGLLKFLFNQKRAIEYDLSHLCVSGSLWSQTSQQSVHCADAVAEELIENKQQPFKSKSSSACLFHNYASHGTDECQLYLFKTRVERIDMLRVKGACWSCLKTGHRLRDCKSRKACVENGCTRTHHKTLHEEKQEARVSVRACSCCEPFSDTCLLLLQRIRTRRGCVNVVWDNATSLWLSFITNCKAKAEMLHGTRVEISIVKVGGTSETIMSNRYLLP